MLEKFETALVCYTQATFDNFEPENPEVEEDEATRQARLIPEKAQLLAAALELAGIDSDIIKVPLRSFQPRDIAKAAFGWRLLDLKESNGRTIDLVICLDFPAWSVSHPHKISWLINLPNFVTRRSSANPPRSKDTNGGANLDLHGNVSSLLQSERRGLAESWRIMAGNRPVAEELARSGLQVNYNPFPSEGTAPNSPEWQTVIKRLATSVLRQGT
ncbi:hypothetical protein [Candidatus Chlorohelix sp.]|uniref:hypothetical protein n=1 Tax=Candidatus Chlorohelix sp. TaxID=3139201 RepID=UPI003023216B